MSKNKLILSAPGSGKTSLIVNNALDIDRNCNVLITTYTESNTEEIRQKIIRKKSSIPSNITVLPWFTFLLRHGVRPYQASMKNYLNEKRIGFYLTPKRSAVKYYDAQNNPRYWGKINFDKYFFTSDLKIYSDKTSEFIIDCNQYVEGKVVNRISRIFDYIYIDEVQDLAGWDLEILKLLFETSSVVELVGDPRQTVYLTHPANIHKSFKNGKIDQFLTEKCRSIDFEINTEELKESHRNNQLICNFSSLLYPEYDLIQECNCKNCIHEDSHKGVFLLKPDDVKIYLREHPNCQILQFKEAISGQLNFGVSKGREFDRVLIYPTKSIRDYIYTGDTQKLKNSVKAKFFVAITRARHSVTIVYDYEKNNVALDEISRWGAAEKQTRLL